MRGSKDETRGIAGDMSWRTSQANSTNEFRYWMKWQWETQTNFLVLWLLFGEYTGSHPWFPDLFSSSYQIAFYMSKPAMVRQTLLHCPPLLPPILQHLSHWLFCLPALLAFMGSCDDIGPTLIPPWWSPYFKVSWLASAPAKQQNLHSCLTEQPEDRKSWETSLEFCLPPYKITPEGMTGFLAWWRLCCLSCGWLASVVNLMPLGILHSRSINANHISQPQNFLGSTPGPCLSFCHWSFTCDPLKKAINWENHHHHHP